MESKPKHTHTEMIAGFATVIALWQSYQTRKSHTRSLLSKEATEPYGDQLKDMFYFGLETASYGAAAIIFFALLVRIFDKRLLNWDDVRNFSIISLLSLIPPWTYIVDSNPYWQEIGAFLAGGISAFIVPLLLLILFFITGSIGKHVSLKIEPGSKYDQYIFHSGYNCVGLFVGLIISPMIAGMIYDIFRDYQITSKLTGALSGIITTILIHFLIWGVWHYQKAFGKYFSFVLTTTMVLILLSIRIYFVIGDSTAISFLISFYITMLILNGFPFYLIPIQYYLVDQKKDAQEE